MKLVETDERSPAQPGNTSQDVVRGQARTGDTDKSAEEVGESGWVTTDVAARSMRVSARTVRRMIERAELEAKPEGEGVERRWLVSVDSLYALRASRTVSGSSSASDRGNANIADATPGVRAIGREDPGTVADIVADLVARLEARAEEATELRVRLQLTEKTQSTAEAERDRLLERVKDLEAALKTQNASETPLEGSAGGEAHPKSQEPSERRSWLYRFFFGP